MSICQVNDVNDVDDELHFLFSCDVFEQEGICKGNKWQMAEYYSVMCEQCGAVNKILLWKKAAKAINIQLYNIWYKQSKAVQVKVKNTNLLVYNILS